MFHRRHRFSSPLATARRMLRRHGYANFKTSANYILTFSKYGNFSPFPLHRLSCFWFAFSRPIRPITVIGRFRGVGLRCGRPKKGVLLTYRHKLARVNWARRHQRFTRRQGVVLFQKNRSLMSVMKTDELAFIGLAVNVVIKQRMG